MAISYDQRKKSYDSMDDSQKQQYNEALKNKWDDYIGNQYMKQYGQETWQVKNQYSNNIPYKAEEQTGKLDGYGTNRDTEWFYTWNSEWEKAENRKLLREKWANPLTENEYNDFYKEQNKSVSPELDTSKFNEAPWQISVKEWSAKDTWKPDYTIDSKERLDEMKHNLDQYFADSPRMFSNRETFNKVFEYNSRESEAQKQLLDSYWKRKEDIDRASNFTSWEAILQWMNDAKITTDQLNYIKENNEEAYRKWQELQEDEIKLRIINDIVPPLLQGISSQLTDMMNSLWIQPQVAKDIEGIYNDTMVKTWAYQTLEDANRTVKEIEEVNNKRMAIMSRYSASTWGTVSDALAAARMQKALAPYNTQMEWLQYQYQDYANLYNQKLATANQAAQVRQMQAQEEQRVWNQKLTALGFAADALSYRTPEQKAQLELQTKYIENEMDLLNESKRNDLNLYNKYATAKLENQLANELTDLSVTDAAQLKNNLNNVLSWYYDQRWAIIQRPQAQVVEDVLAYAKANWVSVAEALKKNFIEPLQSKKEYKTKVAQDFGIDKYQQQYSYTIDEDGNIKISASWYGEIPESAFETRDSRKKAYADVYENSISWESYIQNLAWAIKDGSYGWQCGAFCNDVLVWWWEASVFWDTLESKIKACNVKKEDWPEIWYAVVFDLGFTSEDWENHGHVWFISNVNGDGSIDVIESNWKSDKTIHIRRYTKDEVNKMVMGYYKPSSYDLQKEWIYSYVTASEDKPYDWVSKTTKTWAKVNAGWWITDLEDQYTKDRQNKDLMNQTLKDYWITIQEYNAQKKKYVDYAAKVSLIEDTQKMYDAVKDLLDWNKKYSSSWAWSRHSGTVDRATYDTISQWTETKNILGLFPKFDNQTANGINKYNFLKNSQLLDKYQELKKAGATFWAMQKSEWDLVWSAASKLQWLSTDTEFEETLTEMLNHYNNILADAGVEWFYNTDI